MTVQELIDGELQVDAAKLEFSIDQWESYLNTKSLRGPIPTTDVEYFAILNGILPAIAAASNVPSHPGYGPAYSCIWWFRERKNGTLDLDLPQTQLMLGGLVSSGLATEQQKEELIAMANNKSSIAEKNIGRPINREEIQRILGRSV